MEKGAAPTVQDTEVLLTCSALEKACGRLYRYFATLFAAQKQMKKLWQKTAMEEDEHAEQCLLAYHMRGSGTVRVTLSQEQAAELLARVEHLYQEVQRHPPTLKDALRLALLLEEHTACCRIDLLVVFEDPRQQKYFESMRRADRDHVEALQLALDLVLTAERERGLAQALVGGECRLPAG